MDPNVATYALCGGVIGSDAQPESGAELGFRWLMVRGRNMSSRRRENVTDVFTLRSCWDVGATLSFLPVPIQSRITTPIAAA